MQASRDSRDDATELGAFVLVEELLEALPPSNQVRQLLEGGDVQEFREESIPQVRVPPPKE